MTKEIKLKKFSELYPTYVEYDKLIISPLKTIYGPTLPYWIDDTKTLYSQEQIYNFMKNKYDDYHNKMDEIPHHAALINALAETLPGLYVKTLKITSAGLDKLAINDLFSIFSKSSYEDPKLNFETIEETTSVTPSDDETSGTFKVEKGREKIITNTSDGRISIRESKDLIKRFNQLDFGNVSGHVLSFILSYEISSLWQYLECESDAYIYEIVGPVGPIGPAGPSGAIAKYKNNILLDTHDYDSSQPTSVLSRNTIEGLIQALTLTFYDNQAAFNATSPATGSLAWTDDFDGSGGDNKALMLKTVSDIIEIKDWLDIKNYIDKSTLPHFEHQGTQNYKDFYTANRNSQTIFSGTGNENTQVRTLAEFSGIDNKDGLYKWTEFSDTGIKRWAYNSTASSIVSENGKTIPSMSIGMLSSRPFAWMGSIANLKDEIITSDDVNGYNWTFGQTYLLTSSIYNYFVTPFNISGTKILKGTSEYSDGIWYVEIDTSQTGSGGFVVNKIGQSAYGDLTNINVGVANAGKIVQVNATGGFDYIHDSVSPLGKVDLDLENSAPTKIGANKVGLKMTGLGDATAPQVRMHGNNVDLSVGTNTAGKISFSLPAGSTGQVSVNVGTTKHEIGYADGSNITDTWLTTDANKISNKETQWAQAKAELVIADTSVHANWFEIVVKGGDWNGKNRFNFTFNGNQGFAFGNITMEPQYAITDIFGDFTFGTMQIAHLPGSITTAKLYIQFPGFSNLLALKIYGGILGDYTIVDTGSTLQPTGTDLIPILKIANHKHWVDISTLAGLTYNGTLISISHTYFLKPNTKYRATTSQTTSTHQNTGFVEFTTPNKVMDGTGSIGVAIHDFLNNEIFGYTVSLGAVSLNVINLKSDPTATPKLYEWK